MFKANGSFSVFIFLKISQLLKVIYSPGFQKKSSVYVSPTAVLVDLNLDFSSCLQFGMHEGLHSYPLAYSVFATLTPERLSLTLMASESIFVLITLKFISSNFLLQLFQCLGKTVESFLTLLSPLVYIKIIPHILDISYS